MGLFGETLVKILGKKYNRCQECIFDIYTVSSTTHQNINMHYKILLTWNNSQHFLVGMNTPMGMRNVDFNKEQYMRYVIRNN
jgi:hypothetical protein